jgi:hypothetical protein
MHALQVSLTGKVMPDRRGRYQLVMTHNLASVFDTSSESFAGYTDNYASPVPSTQVKHKNIRIILCIFEKFEVVSRTCLLAPRRAV